MGPIFHIWRGSQRGTRRTRGRKRGKSRGETRETLNRHEYDHTSARSSRHKVTRDPKSTKDDTKVAVLLREEVLIVFSGWRP